MQFALPPRKAAQPPPFIPASRSTALRRRQLKSLAVIGLLVLSVVFLFSRIFRSNSSVDTPVTSGSPQVVVVTVFDEQGLSDRYIQRIKQNREDYAKRHGGLFCYHSFYSRFTRFNLFITLRRICQLLC